MRRGEGGHRVIVAGPRTDRGWDRLSISVLFRPNAIGYSRLVKRFELQCSILIFQHLSECFSMFKKSLNVKFKKKVFSVQNAVGFYLFIFQNILKH